MNLESSDDLNRFTALSKLSGIKSPILIGSPSEDQFVLLTKSGLYEPPRSFSFDIKGPFRFTRDQAHRAEEILMAESDEPIFVADPWGNVVNAVRMVLEMCYPEVDYYQVCDCEAYRTRNEVNVLRTLCLSKFCSENKGRMITWEQMSTKDLGWLSDQIGETLFPAVPVLSKNLHPCKTCRYKTSSINTSAKNSANTHDTLIGRA